MTKGARPAWVIIALCAAVALLEGYDNQAMGVAAPKMMPQLGLGHAQAGWVLSSSVVGLIVGAMLGGRLADRIGRRPVLIGSVVAFGVFSLATVAAKGFVAMVLVRIAFGLGMGGAMPNLIAIAAEVTAPGRRTAVTTLVFCGMSLGGAGSALLARYAPPGLDWRMVFLIGGSLPLALAPAIGLILPETRPRHEGEAHGAQGVAAALFGEGRARSTLPLWAGSAPTLFILYLMLNWLPMLAAAKGLSRADAPFASVAFNLAALIGAPGLGALIDRFGVRWPMAIAYAAMVGVMLALARASGAGQILLFSALAGLLVVGAQFCLYGLAPSYYPSAVRGTGSGAAVAVGRLGSILGPLVAGLLLGGGASAGQVLWTMAPVALAAGAAVLLLSLIGRRIEV